MTGTLQSSLRIETHPRPSPTGISSALTTPDQARESLVLSDYDDLSPLDALAAQGWLLNKRLTQHGSKLSNDSSDSSTGYTSALEQSVFPKFESHEPLPKDRVYHKFEKRHRNPEKRKEKEMAAAASPRSPIDSLSLATMSLLNIPRPRSPRDYMNMKVTRSESQASSVLSLSTSSDESESETETEQNFTSIYQPPPRTTSTRLRPIIKTQHLHDDSISSWTSDDSVEETATLHQNPAARPFSPQLQNTLDRPKLPSGQVAKSTHTRKPSINFSRPYSTRSSVYSDALSAPETDDRTSKRHSRASIGYDEHLSVPSRSPVSESVVSSPGLGDEELKQLPRGRSGSMRTMETGVFFHSKSMRSLNGAHRWPQTPATPTNGEEKKFFPSPESEEKMTRVERKSEEQTRPPLQERLPMPQEVPPLTSQERVPRSLERPSTSHSTLSVPDVTRPDIPRARSVERPLTASTEFSLPLPKPYRGSTASSIDSSLRIMPIKPREPGSRPTTAGSDLIPPRILSRPGSAYADLVIPPRIMSRPGTSGSTRSISGSPRILATQPVQMRNSTHSVHTLASIGTRGIGDNYDPLSHPPPSRGTIFNSPTQPHSNPKRQVVMSIVPVPADTISAEDHVNLGIKYHEQDLLPQSTHHFNLAAEMGSPTGMLLYSLSLRHGWGCAANPAKAVELLHLAAEAASAEVDATGARRPTAAHGTVQFNSAEGKRGGATLALAIYELGQSYMHGWGVAKDKRLALRCYEISANFGDTDGQWSSVPGMKANVVRQRGVI